jgi:purine nucleosidase
MIDRRTFIIDTDTASDDAVAILMALRDPSVDVVALTVVAGNVPLEQAVQNALYTVELAGANVPVYAGAAAPLLQPLHTAQVVHGRDGMGDIGLPLTGRTPAEGHAVDRLADLIDAHEPGRLTLVTLGPLTNVALLFARRPDLATRLGHVVMMGGTSDGVGNITPAAEFNIWVDPEAAAMVFQSGARLSMVGWDISRKYAVFDRAQAAELRSVGRLGAFAVDIQAVLTTFTAEATHLAGFDLPDPIAMGYALDPTIATDVRHLNVVVETRGEYTRGATVCDLTGYSGRAPNVDVVLEASRDAFVGQLSRLLRD